MVGTEATGDGSGLSDTVYWYRVWGRPGGEGAVGQHARRRPVKGRAGRIVDPEAPALQFVGHPAGERRRTDRLERVAGAYMSKYGWNVTVRDGAFQDTEGAPTAGPPPYDVYVITPTTIFAFGTNDDTMNLSTRWEFSR
jgi:hypothetical protein